MSDDPIEVVVNLDDSRFIGKMTRANKVLATFDIGLGNAARSMQTMKKRTSGILPSLRDYVVTISLINGAVHNVWMATGNWMLAIANTNGEIERMRFLLEGMSTEFDLTKRFEETTREMEFFLDQAEKMPFSLKEISNSAVKFKSVGLDPLDGSMNALADAVARFGGNDQVFHRATVAIQQMAGKGVISMEELRQQLGEAVPNAIKLMARAMGKTYRELVDDVSKGLVEASTAIPLMFDEFRASFSGASEKLMDTWSGLLQRLQTRWMKFQLQIGETGYFDEAKEALHDLIYVFDDTRVIAFAEAIGNVLTKMLQLTKASIEFVATNGDTIAAVIKGFGAVIAGALITKLGKAILNIGVLAGAMTGLGKVFSNMKAPMKAAFGALRAGNVALAGFAASSALATAKAGVLSAAIGAMGGPISWIITALGTAAAAWHFFGDSGEKALEKLRRGGTLIDKELEQANDEIYANESKLKSYTQQLEGLNQVINGLGDDHPRSAQFIADREKVANKIIELERSQMQARVMLLDQYAERDEIAGRNHVERIKRTNRDSLDVIKASYVKQVEELDKLREAGTLSQEEQGERIIQLREQQAEAEINLLKRMEAELAESRANTNDQRESNALLEAEKQLARERIQLQRQTLDSRKRLEERSANESAVSAKRALESINRYVENYGARTAKAQAEAAGMNGEVARLKHFIETKWNAANNIDEVSEEVQAAVERLAEYEKQNKAAADAIQKKNDQENAAKKMTELLASAQRSYLNILRETENPLSKDNKVTQLRAEVEQLKREMSDAQLAAFADDIDKALEAATNEDRLGVFTEMAEETRKINSGLLDDSTQLRLEYFKNVSEAIARADVESIANVEERKRREGQLNEYLAALESQYQQNSRSEMQVTLEQWADTTTQMEDATLGFVTSFRDAFVDSLMEGKAQFSDFADHIIKELLTISTNQALSNILGSFDFGSTPSASPGASAVDYSPEVIANWQSGNTARGLTNADTSFFDKTSGVDSKSGFNKVEIINNGSDRLSQGESTEYNDGKDQVLRLVLEGANTPGKFRDGLRQAVK